jgi:8-amino-7-oxononanoate synthase
MTNIPKKLSSKIETRTKENKLQSLGLSNHLVDSSSNDYLGFGKNETLFSKIFPLPSLAVKL